MSVHCDRCSATPADPAYVPLNAPLIKQASTEADECERMDLCQGCRAALAEWLKGFCEPLAKARCPLFTPQEQAVIDSGLTGETSATIRHDIMQKVRNATQG